MTDVPGILYFAPAGPVGERVQDLLQAEGYRVARSADAADALALLMEEPVALLLLDGATLSAFAERVFRQWRQDHPLVEVVGIAAGRDAIEPALVRMDCRRVLRAPIDPDALLVTVDYALTRRADRIALVRGDEAMAAAVFRATQALVDAVELKDVYTRGRADRVALFAGILADELGGIDIDRVRTAARVMDVGKSGVPGEVLNKTERLTDDEFELIRRHPLLSWEMLRHLFRDDVVLAVARHHHERWDGAGYPDALEGPAIPLEARIVAIADSLDAMTSTRAFRQARLWSQAVEEVVAGAGTRYDPELVQVLSGAQERMLVGA